MNEALSTKCWEKCHPSHLTFPFSWVGHTPFIMWLLCQIEPKNFVELGTHSGNSYLASCESIKFHNLKTQCYAVDTWEGDEHAGAYDNSVFEALKSHHDVPYGEFSTLLRMTFDTAAEQFLDESIALLHIDGLHTYEAVKHDFETWLPKMSPEGIVLFHDTTVNERGFGVALFWKELKERYSFTLSFDHSNGLGVLFLQKPVDPDLLMMLDSKDGVEHPLKERFKTMGNQITFHANLDSITPLLVSFEPQRAGLSQLYDTLVHEHNLLHILMQENHEKLRVEKALLESTRHNLESIRNEISQIKGSRSWKVIQRLKKFKYCLFHGWKIGAPNFEDLERFDPNYYRSTYPDIVSNQIDPLAHYILFGKREGRKGYSDDPSVLKIPTPSLLKKFIDLVLYIKNHPHLIKKFAKEIWQHGFRYAIGRAWSKMRGPNGPMVNKPYCYSQPMFSDDIRLEMEQFNDRPLISIIMPVYNVDPKWLDKAIQSIHAQWYENWELCIADDQSTEASTLHYLHSINHPKIKIIYSEKNQNISGASNAALEIAQGDYIALMDNDDELTADALYEAIKAVNTQGGEFIYSDEDKIEMDGTFCDPHFKPDFSPDLFMSQNYISHLGIIKKSLIDTIGGFEIGLEGAQDYDLYLKISEHTDKIVHIPKVLYHWRKIPGSTAASFSDKSYAQKAGAKALNNTLLRRKIEGHVENGKYPGTYRVRYDIIGNPLVSIIIPFKDQPKLLKMCIESILKNSTYSHFEIIGISNNSTEKGTFIEMDRLQKMDSRVSFHEYNVPFNYSQINNYAIQKFAHGEHLVLLNNDIEIITPEWIEALLQFSQRKDIGAVGAKLYYPNNTIQHAGIAIGVLTLAGHSFKHLSRNTPAYMGRESVVHNVSAITAACLMVKKSIYEQMNGLNETELKIAFNDVDFCLRIQEAGYLNLFTPYCEAYHYESISRGEEDTPEKQERFGHEVRYMQTRHHEILTQGDPFYNPNLTLEREDFTLK